MPSAWVSEPEEIPVLSTVPSAAGLSPVSAVVCDPGLEAEL